MEKEMLAIAKLKSGEGKFEKFMGFMQSDEGMAVRKTIITILCDKSDKYSSKMFNKSFLREKGLPFPSWI